jgi:hypothetical protein
MIETILGMVTGGVARIVPEVIKYFDSKNERKHELALGEQNLRLTELQQKGQLAIADRTAEQAQFVAAMEAMKSGIEAQGKPTGIKWVDAMAATVRPVITYWVFLLYAAVKVAMIGIAIEAEAAVEKALAASWGPADDAMLSAILTFWFVGRVWERKEPRLA